jgi:hypothetical protein
MFIHKNYAAEGENSSIMVGMFVFLCLASQKPSEREFFVPARTDLGVKLLILIGWYRKSMYLRWRGQGASLFMIGIVRFCIDFEVGSFALT